MVRVSPGSPSQWMATCSPCPAATCRSTQFTATFRVPSANHLAWGASDQSNTVVNGVAQVSRFACSAQNASVSAAARSYASADRFAFAANPADGGNTRSSVPKLSSATAPFPVAGAAGCDVLAGPLIGLLLDDGGVVVKLRRAASSGPGCAEVAREDQRTCVSKVSPVAGPCHDGSVGGSAPAADGSAGRRAANLSSLPKAPHRAGH